MTKRTPEQESLLAELKAANAALMTARLTAHDRHARLAEEEIRDHVLTRDKLAARLSAIGAPNAMVGEGLGSRKMSTKDPRTIAQAIEHGKQFLGPAETQPFATAKVHFTEDGRYAYDPNFEALTVTMQPRDFEHYEEALTHLPDQPVTFDFDVRNGQVVIPDTDSAWENPVVQVMALPHVKKEANAFLAAQI